MSEEAIKLNRHQRRALLRKDKTSSTPNRSKRGKRMRDRAGVRLESQVRGRAKYDLLFYRAGIILNA